MSSTVEVFDGVDVPLMRTQLDILVKAVVNLPTQGEQEDANGLMDMMWDVLYGLEAGKTVLITGYPKKEEVDD